MNNIQVPVDLFNKIIQYISSRPFIEVAGLMHSINEVVNGHNTMQTEIAKDAPAPEISK